MKMNKWMAASFVAGVAIAGVAVVLTWGPAESRALLQGWGVAAGGSLAAFFTAALTYDGDKDGRADWLQWLFGLFGAGALALALVGCGSTAQQHRTLNTITDIGDPTYELALRGCDDARDFIVAREGSTEQQDRDDMDAVNLACDSIVEGFEALRGTQKTAREFIDEGLGGAAAELVRQALASWAELQELVPRIEQAITSGGTDQ